MAGLFHGVPNAIQSLRSPGAAAGEPLGEQLALFGPDGKPIIEPLAGPNEQPLFPAERFPSSRLGTAVTSPDIARTATGLGSDMINYIINYPRKPEGLAAPQLPPPGPTGIGFPVPPPVPPHPLPPPVLGGGTHTVHHGDSLWAIASRVYGDGTQWTRIAAANPQIADPDLIVSGQVLTLPELPAPHSSATG
ncbi:MAG: hypothetical protein DLM59_04765 [Pseudonocardiales bacterium]|nr:MAG: hypothetical protein DLM59_04765 [Pseudonocardiales bacterium]